MSAHLPTLPTCSQAPPIYAKKHFQIYRRGCSPEVGNVGNMGANRFETLPTLRTQVGTSGQQVGSDERSAATIEAKTPNVSQSA